MAEQGIKVVISIAYYPQIDGQIKKIKLDTKAVFKILYQLYVK